SHESRVEVASRERMSAGRYGLCYRQSDMAKTLEELQVYQRALEASAEVSAILKRASFQRDVRLRENLGASASSVPALIAEGFEQSTDRFFAQYLYRARGSARETRTHLITAQDRHHISPEEQRLLTARFEEVGRMATGLIRHLEAE